MIEPLCSAVNQGAHRARAAAQKAVPKVKAAVSGATYWLGYGVSFASVFSYTLLRELAPEVLKTGCRDGAAAARKSAEHLASKLDPQASAHSEVRSPATDPLGPATQPSV